MAKKKFAIIPVLIIIVGAAVWYYYNSNTTTTLAGNGNAVAANGTLEVTEVGVSSEVSGKVDQLLISEGDNVKEGQLIAVINSDTLNAQYLQAQAALLVNQSKLASAQVGARDEEIAQAQEAVRQAEAVLAGAKRTLSDAKDIYENRAAARQQLDNAKTQEKVAKTQLESAKANRDQLNVSAENAKANLNRMRNLYNQGSVSKQQLDDAQTKYDMLQAQIKAANAAVQQAETSLKGAEVNLKNVKDVYENRAPQKQQVDSAQTQVDVGVTNLSIAQKRLQLLLAGTKKEDLDALRAGVKQAEAAVKLAEVQLGKSKIYAPQAGTILVKNLEQGETVSLGTVIATIGDTSKIWLKVYVPETQIGLVKIGNKVKVKVDSFPKDTFYGTVKEISSKAEFTPRNVQTKEERVNQVFAVKVYIPNPEGKLKSGMPADAEIEVK